MATYEFYIYNTSAVGYNSGTGRFDFSSSYTADSGRYRVVVTDDDATAHATGDSNQTADVYDTAGNIVTSGAMELPGYAELSGPGGYIYLDRLEVGGMHVGYASSEHLTPGGSYPVTDSYQVDIAYSYFEGNSIPCFTQGVKIETELGALDVADIAAGTRVQTLDHGLQEVLCHFITPVSLARLVTSPKLWPVVVSDKTTGCKDLWVSRDHRILVRDPLIGLCFGYEEMLAPAAEFGRSRLNPERWPGGIQYHHLLFETHQIIRANGQWVESFFPGREAIQRLSYKDLMQAEEALGDALYKMKTARPCLSVREVRAYLKIRKSLRMKRKSPPQLRNIRVAGDMRIA
ncbi:Hint domain-containing protein [Roseovarius rhodophyticola]|uniref:Hint domain-containing protein n=1 Tax=Roseovarius rhodophyticola TaxID=3080827 RepID=A0ABZ2TP33_9RHOB|nr:Hint domain-containing protein [Roseovarius sp. W115]MDV2930265.1 Hint domain-containing protein [Roseovarius sp. W115]